MFVFFRRISVGIIGLRVKLSLVVVGNLYVYLVTCGSAFSSSFLSCCMSVLSVCGGSARASSSSAWRVAFRYCILAVIPFLYSNRLSNRLSSSARTAPPSVMRYSGWVVQRGASLFPRTCSFRLAGTGPLFFAHRSATTYTRHYIESHQMAHGQRRLEHVHTLVKAYQKLTLDLLYTLLLHLQNLE